MTTLQLVTDVAEIRACISRFVQGISGHLARSRSIAVYTTYWVYDSASGHFAPSKFAGFGAMNFDLYEEGKAGDTDGVFFSGGVTWPAIEEACGSAYESDASLNERLMHWLAAFGVDTANVSHAKWRFLILS